MIKELLPNYLQFYVLLFMGLISFVGSYVLVYNNKYRISQLMVFNRKPWVCWLCSNFWLSVFLWINLSYIWTPMFLLWGMVITLMTTYVIKKDPWA